MVYSMAITSIEAKDMTGIGLMIGELGLSAVRCGPAGEEPKLIESTASHAPMSVLVPRWSGEPLRLDCVIPLHPRGTGCEWPTEAGIDEERGCGRFPLAAAWAGLPHGRPNLPHGRDWVWHIDGREQAVRPAEAIATAVTDILALHPTLASNGVPTLVIPNSTHEAEQQALLDAARRVGIGLQLLWRPVAAALPWCHRFSDFLRERVSQGAFALDESIGQLACLHVGLAEVELTILDLVRTRHDDQLWIRPARRRPNPRLDVTSGFGWLVLEDCARRFLSSAGLPADRQHLWQLLFASNWSTAWLASFEQASSESSQRVAMPTGLSIPISDIWPRYLQGLPVPQGDGYVELLGSHRLPQSSSEQVSSWSNRCIQEMPDGILGAAVSGEMAAVPLQNEVPLGRALLERILGTTQRLLLGGDFLGRRLLAQGAAMFSARLAAGLPTFLDTLPQLQLLVRYRTGEMVWVPLLEDRDKFVPGGQRWNRAQPVTDLAIEKHKTDLTFAVFHAEYSNIRELPVDLPRASEKDEPIELHVSITPAQGNARLEVCPIRRDLFGTRRIHVDWSRMKIVPPEDGGDDCQAYIDHQPHAYPEHMPRLASRSMWHSARHEIEAFFAADEQGRQYGNEDWNRLKNVLQRSDQLEQQRCGHEVRAVSSDGQVKGDQELLTRLTDRLWVRLRRVGNAQAAGYIVRCLAYASADQPDFSSFLIDELGQIMAGAAPTRAGTGHAQRSYRGAVLLGCGSCLRMPEQTRILARYFVAHFQGGGANYRDWLQAMQAILRYRKAATRYFERNDCLAIVEICSTLLHEQLNRANRGETPRPLIFALAARVIAFLLRRRAFDPGFLDPESGLAMRVKKTCADVMELVKTHKEAISKLEHARIDPSSPWTVVGERTRKITEHKSVIRAFIGGTRDARQALQQIIDYVDRRGIGLLRIAAADDEE